MGVIFMERHQELIKSFLAQNPMAVISTIGEKTGNPESALVAFAELDNLEIIFETFFETRKQCNLQKNSKVSFVIGWDTERHITVQYEGDAYLIKEENVEEYKNIFLAKKTPCTEEFLLDSRVRLYKVTPTWIRYSDYTGDSPSVIEIHT